VSESIGWLATGLFASSYLCRDAVRLRLVQASAAVVWLAYGLAIGARPVVVANAIVAALAVASSASGLRRPRSAAEPADQG
jgi:hypothetical protein